ncbi:MAG: hypothetical protein AAGC97_17130, partial [Planctomycetota bacterium]
MGIAANREAAVERFPPASDDYFEGMDAVSIRSTKVAADNFDREDVANESEPRVNQDQDCDDDHETNEEDSYPSGEFDRLDLRQLSSLNETHLAEADWTPNQVKGRNAWLLWTGGNEAFWDWLARHGYGTIDLLKLVDSRGRQTRFQRAGMINEPGTRACNDDEAKQTWGLYIDRLSGSRTEQYRNLISPVEWTRYEERLRKKLESTGTDSDGKRTADPYKADEATYGSEYAEQPDADVYGYSTGVVGLRLFTNPEFTGSAIRHWDADRFYTDRSYATDPATIRPFRVGMTCAFCHVAPHPLNPPTNVEQCDWENLSSVIGNQYLRVRETFGNQTDPGNYFYHLLDSQLPGTIDTSLIASDNINNANTMNAVFGLSARVRRSLFNPAERLSDVSEGYPGVWDGDAYPDDPLESFQPHRDQLEGNPRSVPRILVDGSDSVGSWLALARVYFNIGSYHQNWIRLHNTNLGFRDQSPFTLEDADNNSVYWHATLARVGPMTDFFIRSSTPMKLADAVGADSLDLPGQGDTLDDHHAEARQVFARTCIACHSSIQPGTSKVVDCQLSVDGVSDLTSIALTMDDLWRLTRGDGTLPRRYVRWAEQAVELESFWSDNYLSTDMRLPVTMVQTHSARAVATNAMHGQMWEDFSSVTYRELSSVGEIRYQDPFARTSKTYRPPA